MQRICRAFGGPVPFEGPHIVVYASDSQPRLTTSCFIMNNTPS